MCNKKWLVSIMSIVAVLLVVSFAHAEEQSEYPISENFLQTIGNFVVKFMNFNLRGVVGNSLGMNITDELIPNGSTSI